MHRRQGLLAAAAAALLAVPAGAANDPLRHAQGLWSGTAGNGYETFAVSVTLKKINRVVVGSGKGRSKGGTSFKGTFEAAYVPGGYALELQAGTALGMIKFDLNAAIISGTELELSSFMGGGTVRFKDDFTRCELDFKSAVTTVTAELRRTHPPPSAPAPAAGKGKKAPAPPPIPPFIMVR